MNASVSGKTYQCFSLSLKLIIFFKESSPFGELPSWMLCPRHRLLASLTLAPALLLLHTRMISSKGSFLPVLPSPQAPSAGFWPEWQPRVNVEGGRVPGELPSENCQGFFSDRSRQRYREFGWPWGQNVRWQGEKSASRLEDFAKWRELESEH